MTRVRGDNLADLVRAAAGRHPDKDAFVAHGHRLSWRALDERVDAVARALLGRGLAAGDRVAVQLGNTLDFPAVYFGVLRAGLVAVPVNTGYTAAELAYCLGDCGARVLVTGRSGAPVAASVAGGLPALEAVLVAGVDALAGGDTAGSAGGDTAGSAGGDTAGSAGGDTAGAAALEPLLQPGEPVAATGSGEDLAVVIYTSGTSGRPRGAMLSHRALLANLDQTAQIDPPVTTPDDVVLLVLPLFHIYGLNAALGAVVREGATGVLVERFDPVETLAEIRARGVTGVVGAPPMYVAWSMLPDVGDAFASVRLALSGAAPLPSSVLHRVLDVTGHHVFEGYGLTETAPVLTTTLMSEVAKPGSIGRAVPGVELRLVDEQGREVDEGDPGEISVRGPNLFSGYWPGGVDGPDEQGWFATGDIAYADEQGDLHLVDRRKELILVSGFNVYPREVEDVLATHPDVAEAAVLGVPHPYTGESVKALVVPREGSRPSADDVIAHCARSLARFKCPTSVEFVAELPHSATGKVSKGRLREAGAAAG